LRDPSDETWAVIHRAAYADLNRNGIKITDLKNLVPRAILSSAGCELDSVFSASGAMGMTVQTPRKVDWELDPDIVPYHIAGCLGMTEYMIRKPVPFNRLYKKYMDLVRDTLAVYGGEQDFEAKKKEVATMMLAHAHTTRAYICFFYNACTTLKLDSKQVQSLNATWVGGLFSKWESKVASMRSIITTRRNMQAAMTMFQAAENADEGSEVVDEFAEPG
jgi:hypothetical protein